MTVHEVTISAEAPLALPQAVEAFPNGLLKTDPFLYPGVRPETSFLTDGTIVLEVRAEPAGDDRSPQFRLVTAAGEQPLDDYLLARGLASMADRVPILAYGANMCPGSLASKFGKGGPERADLLTVPTVYVDLPGHDIVWSGGPGVNGNFIAQLYNGPETAGTTIQVGVNFLTREQLLMLHATELAYELSSLTVEIAGQETIAYYYVGQDSVHLRDGKPIALATVKAENRQLAALDAERMTGSVMELPTVRALLAERYPDMQLADLNPNQYVELIRSLGPPQKGDSPRLNLKRAMAACLREQGAAKIIDKTEGGVTEIHSWANPSTLPTYGESQRGERPQAIYRLPEMELDPKSWVGWEATRRKIIGAVATHHARMLENRSK